MRGKPTPVNAVTHTVGSSSSADVVHTFAAASGVTHVLHWITYSYSGAGALVGGHIQVEIASSVIWEIYITEKKAGEPIEFPDGLYGNENEELKVTLTYGTNSLVGALTVETT